MTTSKTSPISEKPLLLHLAQYEVTAITFDYRVQLQLLGIENEHARVTIGGHLIFNKGIDRLKIDPEASGEPAPLLSLLRSTVKDAVIGAEGELAVSFSTGARITVPADPTYEAWELSAPLDGIIVCMPGGELAMWSNDTD